VVIKLIPANLLDKAIELSDKQADELARLYFTARRHRSAIKAALWFFKNGKPEKAKRMLEAILEKEREP